MDMVLGIAFGWIHGLDYTLTLFRPGHSTSFCAQLRQFYKIENKWLHLKSKRKKKTLISTPYSNATPIYDHYFMEYLYTTYTANFSETADFFRKCNS
ncbi:hypothetical protein CMK12_10965 [Candidatus Poribacteria bacterium]|nr:hypothetical protein [Candidatus Poribacteria bacterium]